jgi:hypothetical protein
MNFYTATKNRVTEIKTGGIGDFYTDGVSGILADFRRGRMFLLRAVECRSEGYYRYALRDAL